MTQVRGQRKFATDKPRAQSEGLGVYQWQTSDDRGRGEYRIHGNFCGTKFLLYSKLTRFSRLYFR